MFELNNDQRKYFGLELVSDTWERVPFKGDTYRPDSVLYYDNNTIRKQVISNESIYKELQYSEETDNRTMILPKTKKGKPKKLSPSVLESRTPIGVYLEAYSSGRLLIGNHTTQKTFYSTDWEHNKTETGIEDSITKFIDNSPPDHFKQIEVFCNAKRKNVKYKAGDFFSFKLNRFEYGFGRILFDIHKARKKKLIPDNHGLNLLMGPPLLIKLYIFKSENKNIDVELLKHQNSLPSDYIMDNIIFYGDFEIIGNMPLDISEFDFPISYGMRIDGTQNVFLQWGLIHKELPIKKFDKYTMPENGVLGDHNPYGYYSIGFRPNYDTHDIVKAINNGGLFDYSTSEYYSVDWDLRNPKNEKIRIEIFRQFKLDHEKTYFENSKLTGTNSILELIDKMK